MRRGLEEAGDQAARNTNGREGSFPWDELAQHSKVP
jgi:hypothetical protein